MNKPRSIQDVLYFIMKITLTQFLLMVILTSLVSAASLKGQGILDRKVSIDAENTEIKSILSEIEKQTSVVFTYRPRLIKASKKISFKATDARLADVLVQLFSPEISFLAVDEEEEIVLQPSKDLNAGERVQTATEILAITVSGKVTDETGQALPGVNVVEKGTTNGTTTDINGRFSLNVANEESILVFSFIGYETKEVQIGGRTEFSITLQPDIKELDEVVVVGYGTQKKSDLTGSVVRINMTEKVLGNNMNLLQSIQGYAPGLNVTGGGALAGDEPSFSIRGRTSLSASDRPLVVLDGIIYNGSLSDININDVETIDVLKDASAAAVYGSRSANGVIIVTTKRGNTDKPRLTFNSTVGVQDFTKDLPVMNAEQYAVRLVDYSWEQQLYTWYATKPTDATGKPARPDITDRNVVALTLQSVEERDNYIEGGHDIDWVEEVSRTALMQNYDLNLSGKSDRSNYYISGSYTGQDGVLLNDQFKRTTVRTNIENEVTDWLTVGLTSLYSYRDYSGLETGIARARSASPLANMYTANGTYAMYLVDEVYQVHPLANLLTTNSDIRNNLFVLATAKVEVPKINGLTYDFNYSNTFYTVRSNTWYPPTIQDGAANRGRAIKNDSEERSWIINNILTYTRTFATDHRVNATFLFSRENRKGQNSNLLADGFGNPILGYDAVQLGTTQSVHSGAWEENSLSYMARTNYVYKNRYMIAGTVRKDGFSGFGVANKFAIFPSVSFAWVASEESFIKNMGTWLNELKLRISYGVNGNQGIGRYSSFSTMSSNTYIYGSTTAIGVYPSSMGNEDLAWESTNSLNFGLNYAVLDHRISGSVDVYTAQTSNVLVRRALPSATGYGSVWTNIGAIDNKGIEVALTTVNINGPLQWDTRFAFSLNRDKISKLYGGREMDIGNSWFVGKPISAIYDYKMTGGLWTEQELYSDQITTAGFYPGQWRLADLNGDGIIDPNNDRSIIGYRTPNYRFSINNTLSYKNFTLNIFLNSIMGGGGYYLENNEWILTHGNVPSGSRNTEDTRRKNQFAIRQYWTPDNGVDNSPGIFYWPATSAGLYEDRSFVRLQDISLTYRFNQRLLNAIKLAGCDIFLSGKNLYTWTKWSGWDPETASDTSPMMKSITAGVRLSW